MKTPRVKVVLFFLSVAVVTCVLSPGIFGDNEKDNRRTEEALREGIPQPDLGNGFFRNPVLGPGADNTAVKVGKDYYMLSGGGWPYEIIWHSRDLVNWAPVTPPIHKFTFGAADLTYYKGKFYIYRTAVDLSANPSGVRPRKTYVLWADRVEGPWSDPIELGVPGYIDPGHIADQQGNRFLYFNKGVVVPLAPDGLSAIGEPRKVYDGWDIPKDWMVACKCLEAPKLFYRDGYYYMESAEGGTDGPSVAHMEVVARSKSAEGPWENSPYNPLVHTASANEKWWRQGHGTLLEGEGGKWWFLYTGYENGYEIYGKQNLLLPIEWTDDGWPRVPFGVSATDVLSKPAGENLGYGLPLSDDFSSSALGIQWQYDTSVKPEESFKIGGGKLVMKAAGGLPGKNAIPSGATMIGVTPVNHSYEADVEVTIPDTAEAGLFLSSRRGDIDLGPTWGAVGLRKGEIFSTAWDRHGNDIPSKETHLFLRLRSIRHDFSGSYSLDGKTWIPFENSTRVTDGRRLSLYAAGTGDVVFRNFKYHGMD
jgi:xylan 1,4-beta-xylosidase